MGTFQKYKEGPKRRRAGQCYRCAKPVQGRVMVTLQGREAVEGRTVKETNRVRYPAIDSLSASFCESCAVELYEELKGKLVAEMGVFGK